MTIAVGKAKTYCDFLRQSRWPNTKHECTTVWMERLSSAVVLGVNVCGPARANQHQMWPPRHIPGQRANGLSISSARHASRMPGHRHSVVHSIEPIVADRCVAMKASCNLAQVYLQDRRRQSQSHLIPSLWRGRQTTRAASYYKSPATRTWPKTINFLSISCWVLQLSRWMDQRHNQTTHTHKLDTGLTLSKQAHECSCQSRICIAHDHL